ncbi:MAG: hypothetical protein Q8R25_00945 [bacterium]|nr:hypothetical protein [bacterium]
MIKRILIILCIFMVLALVGLWFVTGGFGRASRASGTLSNPVEYILSGKFFGGGIRLPWQPESLTEGPDISRYGSGENDTDELLGGIQDETDAVRQSMYDVKVFGDPSPYRGQITLSGKSSSSDGEYIQVHAHSANTGPITITGWYLQSVLTGVRVPLPPGASLFVLGVVNPVTSVSLNPGSVTIVNTGLSPVGVSFRENVCSGYLAQYQTFVPDLDNACPDPKNALPEIPENLQRYSASCFTYVQNLSSCRFPGNTLPNSLSSACKSFIVNTYSYNGCVNLYQFRTNFKKDSWRLFLGSRLALWNSDHDIIRLLDASGRTVDVLKY